MKKYNVIYTITLVVNDSVGANSLGEAEMKARENLEKGHIDLNIGSMEEILIDARKTNKDM